MQISLLQLISAALLALAANAEVYLNEQFLDGDAWRSRWVNSEHKSDYGQFKLTAGNFYGDAEKDKAVKWKPCI